MCRAVVSTKRMMNLFKAVAIQQNWISRITALVGVYVCKDDGLPPYMCEKCKNLMLKFEKSLQELEEFKGLVKCSISALERTRGPRKRTKTTGDDIGASPNTIKERPNAKIARRLDYTCESELLCSTVLMSFCLS